jgi:hypothetical protein
MDRELERYLNHTPMSIQQETDLRSQLAQEQYDVKRMKRALLDILVLTQPINNGSNDVARICRKALGE